MPDTSAVKFNVNTYRDDFKKLMVTALQNAVKDGKLLGGSTFAGNITSSATVEQYAEYVPNAVIYQVSCEVMSLKDNDDFVTSVVSTYSNYCDNILTQDSGVNAFLNYMFLTHGFEAEIRDDIDKFCDVMITQAGFYGMFALNCAGQSSVQTQATIEGIREKFTKTLNSLGERKKKAITGHDNYCYILGKLVDYKLDDVTSQLGIQLGLKRDPKYV